MIWIFLGSIGLGVVLGICVASNKREGWGYALAAMFVIGFLVWLTVVSSMLIIKGLTEVSL